LEQLREFAGNFDGGTKRNQGLSVKSEFPSVLEFNGFGKSRQRVRESMIKFDEFLDETTGQSCCLHNATCTWSETI